MRNVKELWPRVETSDYGLRYSPSYSEIIAAIGEIMVESSDNDYQGTTYALVQKDGRFGYLEFGWGSCSYCDALQGCETIAELQELCNGLESSVHWCDSKAELKAWLEGRDWEGMFSWHDGAKEFLPKALATLSMTRDVSPETTR